MSPCDSILVEFDNQQSFCNHTSCSGSEYLYKDRSQGSCKWTFFVGQELGLFGRRLRDPENKETSTCNNACAHESRFLRIYISHRQRDTTSLRWRARVSKTTTTAEIPTTTESRDADHPREKAARFHRIHNGCFGTGLSWVDGIAAGAVGSSLFVLSNQALPQEQLHTSVVTQIAATTSLLMGPYAAHQKRKLREMGTLRTEHNRLRQETSEINVQNEVLLRRIQRLDGAVASLERTERELYVFAKNQSELERLQHVVERRNQILLQMKQCLIKQVLQDILAVVIRADRDSDFQISPQEMEVLVIRMNATQGMQFNERNFRALMAAGDRRIASVFAIIRNLMKDDDQSNDIFTFHPESLLSQSKQVV